MAGGRLPGSGACHRRAVAAVLAGVLAGATVLAQTPPADSQPSPSPAVPPANAMMTAAMMADAMMADAMMADAMMADAMMTAAPDTARDTDAYRARTRWYRDRLVGLFRTIAFSGEYDGPTRRGRLIRWQRPLKLHVLGLGVAPDDYFAAVGDIDRFVRELSRLTGQKIGFVADRTAANVRINLLSRHWMADLRPGTDCFAEVTYDRPSFQITEAVVQITIDDRTLRKHCIHEELSQIMGLTNDSAVYGQSIFSDRSMQTRLKRIDRLMLMALHQPQLRPGMTEAEAMPVVERIMDHFVVACPIKPRRVWC